MSKNITMTLTAITPDMASEWLATSPGNRNVTNETYKSYADIMKRGLWQSRNPHGIAFDEDGRLRDGHHRLHAIIHANMTVTMYVLRNVPNSVIPVIDRGRMRSISDIIRMKYGDKDSKKNVAVINALLEMERAGNHHWKITTEIVELIKNRLPEELKLAATIRKGKCPDAFAAVIAYAYPINPAKVKSLVAAINKSDAFVGTAAGTLLTLLSNRTKLKRSEIFGKVARLVMAHIKGEKISRAHDTNIGIMWIIEQRKNLGFPTISEIIAFDGSDDGSDE